MEGTGERGWGGESASQVGTGDRDVARKMWRC
jgi:hypothetical protein